MSVPTAEGLDKALTFLVDNDVIGQALGPSEFAPGNRASLFFHSDASNHLLPVEITFGSLHVHMGTKPIFLPAKQPVELFGTVSCGICDEPIDDEGLHSVFDRMGVFPLDRIKMECLCCQSVLGMKDMVFSQPVTSARFWLHVESASFARVNQSFIDRLSQQLGLPLVVVPEYLPENVEEWAPARRIGR